MGLYIVCIHLHENQDSVNRNQDRKQIKLSRSWGRKRWEWPLGKCGVFFCGDENILGSVR